MLNRRWTVIVVGEGRATARRYRIPYVVLPPLILGTLAALYGIGVLIYQREMITRQLREVKSYARQNALLKRQNSLFSEEAVRLAERVDEIAERADRFQTALGFDSKLSVPSGLGGPDATRRLTFEETGRLAPSDLDALHDEARGVDHDLRAVEDVLKSRSELLASVPSIAPVKGAISSGFGYRSDPFTGARSFHPALDISNDRGAPVKATADGVITSAGYESGYGLCINIAHDYGFSTRYGHLLALKVRVGQQIKKGEIVGVVGSTGRSTGYHLHYEVRIKDEPVDPTPYMVELNGQADFAARLESSLLKGARGRDGVNPGKEQREN